MKTKLTAIVFAGLTCSGISQGFVNLDFEAAIQPLVPDAFGLVPVNTSIPGWRAYIGGSEVNGIYYNSIALDAAAISLHSPNSVYPILEGDYCIFLQSSRPVAPQQQSAAVGQTGVIPDYAQSLYFIASNPSLVVNFDGHLLPTTTVGTSGANLLLGADISAFAGTTGELLFTRPTGGGAAFLDNIQFSSVGIPEPTVLSLFSLGLLALGWCARRRRA